MTQRMQTADSVQADRPGLELRDISHAYGENASVSGVSLTVGSGEVLCLLGPSGCGKTTLMRVAAGVEQQTAGSVLIDGVEVSGPDCFLPPEKRGVGLMFQDYALFPHMTILKNVLFGLKGLGKADARGIAMAALERVGLAAYADDYPHALSGGEQQRVALARAIAPSPRILLMDEPFSGLDKRLRDRVREHTLEILKKTGASSIVVTHDPEEAMRMGDRIALMRQGKLVQCGSPTDLYRRPVDLETARFFSDLNELSGRITSSGIDTELGELPLPAGDHTWRPGNVVLVCIRPNGFKLSRIRDGSDGVVVGSRRFVGEVDLVTLKLPNSDISLYGRLHPGHELQPGDAVSVTVDPSEMLVFSE